MPAQTNGGAGTPGLRHPTHEHRPRRQIDGEKIMAEIGAIPAILAFQPAIFAQLDELCELRGFTHHKLVVEAVKSRLDGWEQISDEVLTPIAPGEKMCQSLRRGGIPGSPKLSSLTSRMSYLVDSHLMSSVLLHVRASLTARIMLFLPNTPFMNPPSFETERNLAS
jgi:hypothetical protein